MVDTEMDLYPYLLFVNAIRSPLTRQKYFGRLNSFFDFILIPSGNLDERCKLFVSNCNENPKYSLNCVYRFVIHLKAKMQKGEIVVSTIYNYLILGSGDVWVEYRRTSFSLYILIVKVIGSEAALPELITFPEITKLSERRPNW